MGCDCVKNNGVLKVHRFFVKLNQISENNIVIEDSDVNHIKNVLRLRKNEEIVICDGQNNDYYCIINTINNDKILLDIREKVISNNELSTKIYLFQGIPKNDKMDFIIQKAVELGVYEMIPVVTKRTIVKLNKKNIINKLDRWNSISESAAKQSKRGIIPKVSNILSFEDSLKYSTNIEHKFIPYELCENNPKNDKILQTIKANSIGIFIGPEGGFEKEEIDIAVNNNIIPISLGRRILRTETATLATLSILMYNLEEG